MSGGLLLLKDVVGRDWKFILVFFLIAVLNLILNHWLFNILGFISNLLLIGYIIFSTNNDVVLMTIDKIRGKNGTK
jgi:hypothetical protein